MRRADNPQIRDLVQRMLAHEGSETGSSPEDMHAVARVCEKLRRPFGTLTGIAGFRSLLARALTLAKQEFPDFDGWEVKSDGSLEALQGETAQSGAVFIANLIGLMITFIGESLTLRLLQDVWPDLLDSEIKSEGNQPK